MRPILGGDRRLSAPLRKGRRWQAKTSAAFFRELKSQGQRVKVWATSPCCDYCAKASIWVHFHRDRLCSRGYLWLTVTLYLLGKESERWTLASAMKTGDALETCPNPIAETPSAE